MKCVIKKAGCPDAIRLMAALDADLAVRYPGVGILSIDSEHFESDGGTFVIGYVGDQAVACGALRRLDSFSAEVKRMYVDTAVRRLGYGKIMLAYLEALALQSGYMRLMLGAGDAQPEALRLYEKSAWLRTAPFGGYAAEACSVCYTKLIQSTCTKDVQRPF